MKRTAEPDSFSYEPYKFRRLGDPGEAWSHTEWTACGPEAVTPEPDLLPQHPRRSWRRRAIAKAWRAVMRFLRVQQEELVDVEM